MRTKNITAAIATIGLLVMTSCGGSSDQAESYQAPDIAVLTTSFSPADHELSFPAILQGKTDIEIRPQVTGFIIKVHVYEGQVVKKGQPLFTIDQVQYKAAVSQAAANVSAAKTEVNKAKLTVQNKRRLFEKDIISAFEMEIAESDLKNAQSMLVNAQASLASAQQNLDYTVVKAPSNGVVGKLPLREGSLASPSNPEPLTTVSDNSQIYVIFSVTEKDLLYLSENGKVSLNEAIKMAP
ncbi:MAG: efflux RND transporter periplasmic adaptor subunit, partial [Mogibacterium sp.]|nr:efflux RND transporter periplasmic adaptor subunit [Mogibacterium sp.]